jgi:hypothetical protein
MKKLIVLSVIVLMVLPLLAACQPPTTTVTTTSTLTKTIAMTSIIPGTGTATSVITTKTAEIPPSVTPVPFEQLPTSYSVQAPDDIVNTLGSYAYRANVLQGDVKNPWPPIEVSSTVLGSFSDSITIYYRSSIETKAGETRNNIIYIIKQDGLVNRELTLYSVAVPDGIGLANGGQAGPPGALGAVLMIEISPVVAPGQYVFKIGIEIDSNNYGTILCTVNVTGK